VVTKGRVASAADSKSPGQKGKKGGLAGRGGGLVCSPVAVGLPGVDYYLSSSRLGREAVHGISRVLALESGGVQE